MPKQKDNRYRAKITVGHDASGNPIVKYVSGRTRRELDANKTALRKKYIDGIEDIRQDVLFGVYVREWYDTYKEPSLGQSSKNNYISALKKHILPVFEDRQLRAIRSAELQRFMNDRAELSRSLIGTIYSILVSVFRRAASDGIISIDPASALTKAHAPGARRRALTDAETTAALKVGSEHPEGLILLILYYTGARVGEALGLQWRDIDFAKKQIFIRRDIDHRTNTIGNVKTTASVRRVPMPDVLMDTLDKVRGIGDSFVLTSPKSHAHLCKSTYDRRWAHLMEAMHMVDESIEHKAGRSVLTAHFFRHNYATVLYSAGVDVLTAQRFLGHADAKTTLSIYSHLSAQKEIDGAETVRKVFSDGKVAKKLPVQLNADEKAKTKKP